MWLPSKAGGEYAVDIGAKVKFTDSGQIQVVDDDGQVSSRASVYYCNLYQFEPDYFTIICGKSLAQLKTDVLLESHL